MNNTDKKLTDTDLVPEAYAQKCPVCNGFGTLKYGSLQCHACLGKGYILIPLDKEVRESAL